MIANDKEIDFYFPTTINEIEYLIKNEVKESLHLEYKASESLKKDDQKATDQMIKDVTAFSNSDGGVIIYGVLEKDKNVPEKLDFGSEVTKEKIESILNSNISPRISGIKILQFEKSRGKFIYALKIPKSYNGPHQSKDKKYYKRYNFESLPMDHYEIFDIAGRRNRIKTLINIDFELKGSSIFFTVENIGDLLAEDLVFKFQENFDWPIIDQITLKKSDFPKALKNGIKSLQPGKKLRYYYGNLNYQRHMTDLNKNFEVIVEFYHKELCSKISETFYLSLEQFHGIRVHQDDTVILVDAISSGFSEVKFSIDDLKKTFQEAINHKTSA